MTEPHYFTDKPVVTRKPHRCIWCNEKIPVKSTAQYRSYVFDGSFQWDWMHPECYLAMCLSDIDEDGFLPGENKRGCDDWGNPTSQPTGDLSRV